MGEIALDEETASFAQDIVVVRCAVVPDIEGRTNTVYGSVLLRPNSPYTSSALSHTKKRFRSSASNKSSIEFPCPFLATNPYAHLRPH